MTTQRDADTTEQKTPHRKECEHRAWEIIHDAPMQMDMKDGALLIDFKHLANDIADAIESAEQETQHYKEQYEEAMRLLGIPAYGSTDRAGAEPAADRNEYWWVRFEGKVVAAEVLFRDGRPKEVMFFGTDYFAKAEKAELMVRISPLPGLIDPVYDGPEDAVRKVRAEIDNIDGKGDKRTYADYALGYREACDHVVDCVDEAREAGNPVDHADAVKTVLDRFERLVSKIVEVGYASGYRDACRRITYALTPLSK